MNQETVKSGNDYKPSSSIKVTEGGGGSPMAFFKQKPVSFKAIHVTDIHLKGNAVCAARLPIFKNSLAIQSFDYILHTGDISDNPTEQQPAMVADLMAHFNSLKPTISARGNHDGDISNATLGMEANYYYRDIGSKWRIIVLYSQGGGNYALGAEQTLWLSNLLSNTVGRFVCIMSHVPIVSVAGYMWYISHGSLASQITVATDHHSDIKSIVEIFLQHPKVKVCLSGHEHTIDAVEHLGVKYLCSGAVSGNWWNDSTYKETYYKAGYRMITFYDDGEIEHEFINY